MQTPRFSTLLVVVAFFAGSPASIPGGELQTLREDVQGSAPSESDSTILSAPTSPTPRENRSNSREPSAYVDEEGNIFFATMCLAGAAVTSPLWGPFAITGDSSLLDSGCFPRFPYDGLDGYVQTHDVASKTRPWSVRLDAEYAETFNHLDNVVDSHLLIETAPRFGVAASVEHLEEKLDDGSRDQLNLGDCNLVYRFAQTDWAEFRAGLGANWLADPRGPDELGFNFTYAFDVYPRKPWVWSTTIDWGTLGHAELFRARTTVGVVFHGIETYVGYEYTDIDRSHWNGLVAGLRLWF